MKDLEGEINRVERQIAQQRRQTTNVQAGEQNPAQGPAVSSVKEKKEVGKRIVLLENRLDGVMVGFNATLAQNSAVRKEIDHLVQERATFNDMIARLQKKIAGNKKVIADITEMAILAFDQRDEAQSKITALQDRNEKDAQQYAAELKELQRTLDHDEKLKDFLFHKSNDRAFAADFVEEEKDRERKEAEAKDLENTKQFKEAFERIKKVVASDSSLDKIVADFIKVEDQNFALFNYVTEMNNQVEGLQESIAKLRTDIKEAKGRGDERERQQKDQLMNMERRVALSIREADTAEAKLELMEGVIDKLKFGVEELYLLCQAGSTPVLSLLGGLEKATEIPERPFVNEKNIIMYLDMVNERSVELKGIGQFVDAQAKAKEGGKKDLYDPKAMVGLGYGEKKKQVKDLPSCAALLGKAEEEEDSSDLSEAANIAPFEMSTLKARAYKLTKREREDEIKEREGAQQLEEKLKQRRSSLRGHKS